MKQNSQLPTRMSPAPEYVPTVNWSILSSTIIISLGCIKASILFWRGNLNCYSSNSGFKSAILKPAAAASPGNLLQKQIIGPTLDLKNRWGEAICVLTSLQVILMHAKVWEPFP